ncbi:MAG: carbon-nitrogen hydrolase family protein [Planctomycetota bacterium]
MTDRRRFFGLLGACCGGIAGGAMVSGARRAAAHPAEPAAAPAPSSPGVLRLALMQTPVHGADQAKNLAIAEALCREAAAQQADLLVMPEMWNIGYQGFSKFDAETAQAWSEQAIDADGPWLGRFRELARELGIAIAATYLQQWPGGPRNTVSVIDRHGEVRLTYGKVHTCDFAFEAALTPGDGWSAVELDTAKGPVSVGAMICFDREFPESARSLMLAGAEVVVTPNACLLDELRLAQFQVRAYENAMVMAMANYCGATVLNGQSIAFDGAGQLLVRAGEEEGLVYADVNLANLRDYRTKTLWGNAWRKPGAYQALTAEHTIPAFQRTDAFGRPADFER